MFLINIKIHKICAILELGDFGIKMNENEFRIEHLKSKDIPSTIKVFNSQLGMNYITATFLRDVLKEKMLYCKVIKEKASNIIVGACLYGIIDNSATTELTKGHEIDKFKNIKQIGFIKTIAVLSKYQNLGLGTKLLQDVLNELNRKVVDMFISTAWEHSGITNVSSLLKKFGFVEKFKICNYWYEDSLEKKYQCPVCGNPCHCNCVVYIK